MPCRGAFARAASRAAVSIAVPPSAAVSRGITTRPMRSFMFLSERRGVPSKFGGFRSKKLEARSDPLVERVDRVIAAGVRLSCRDPGQQLQSLIH